MELWCVTLSTLASITCADGHFMDKIFYYTFPRKLRTFIRRRLEHINIIWRPSNLLFLCLISHSSYSITNGWDSGPMKSMAELPQGWCAGSCWLFGNIQWSDTVSWIILTLHSFLLTWRRSAFSVSSHWGNQNKSREEVIFKFRSPLETKE